jgi:glutathione S-transferase
MLEWNHSAFAGESVTQWGLRNAVSLNFAAVELCCPGGAISPLARKPLSQRRLRLFTQKRLYSPGPAFVCGFAAVDRSLRTPSGAFTFLGAGSPSSRGSQKLKVAASMQPRFVPTILRSEGTCCAGEHFIIDLHGAKRLDDIDHIEATRRCWVAASRATLLQMHFIIQAVRLLPNLPIAVGQDWATSSREDVPICQSQRWSISLAIAFSWEEIAMKLYMHPVSMTSRPVRLFIAENKIPVEEVTVDLFTGEHYGPAYTAVNPNNLVPMIEDGDLRLTESSAILKYLADKVGSPAYPKDLKQRAKVNEMMDWLNTNFYRDWAYNLAYPQLFPNQKRRSDEAQAATIEIGQQNAKRWLKILNDHWIGPKKQYLCGDQITIADYFGAALVTLGEVIRCDFSAYPNVQRWLNNMKKLPSWGPVNEVFHGLVASVKEQPFHAI